ncbi:MAG: uroporphyrinogen-III synthase [Paracoccaceae bacterium]|nr:uroporphyrinogen-III synthase [Paracoccaceae bacterium]
MGDDAPIVIAPVVEIRAVPGAPGLEGFAGAIFTSENGVRALGAEGQGRRAWCVGERTAAAAREAGFDAVAAEGDAGALVEAVIASGERGPFLHARGREARGEVAGRLRAAGIGCEEAVVYEQLAAPLASRAQALLAGDAPVLVPLFSPNSAARLAGAIAEAGVRAPLLVAAMSTAVGEAWSGPAPKRLAVARRPDAPAMLDALEGLAASP